MKKIKKILIGLFLIIGFTTQANAADYTAPLVTGGVVLAAGLVTGGVAWFYLGAVYGITAGSATIAGGTSFVSIIDED